MRRIVIFGNSGSGKSTFAQHMCEKHNIAHLDLDTLAWQDTQPPTRKPIDVSHNKINQFINAYPNWVIEGCYSDLIEYVLPKSNEIYFLNLSIEACIENAKKRPWEPHKYATKALQDANLSMLIDWIKEYPNRNDEFSLKAHQKLFNEYGGTKHMYENNIEIKPYFKR